MNCSSRVSSNLTGRPVFSAASARMSSTNISCLPPKPPPTRSQNTRTLSGGKIEEVRQRASGQERHLCAGADIEDSIGIDPGEAAMGFQRGVLHPLRRERTLIGDRGLRQCARDIAKFAMDFRDDVAGCVGDAVCERLVAVKHGCTRRNRRRRIEHRRQYFILDLEAGGSLLRRRLRSQRPRRRPSAR